VALVDLFIAGGLIASLCGALITWVVVVRLFKDQRRMFREMPPAKRRSIYRQVVLMYGLVGGYFALLVVHPFGLRNTFIYCLIIPFLVFAPLGTLLVGLRSRRRPRSDQQPYQHH
jgi:hypothetical protein